MMTPDTQRKPTVLIVDDNVTNVNMVAEYLEAFDFLIMTVLNGEKGIEQARIGQPDVILLDVMMPGMDGFEVCRRLKQDERTQEIPVIFMTALDDVKDQVKGFAVGGVDYITKPVQQEVLLARVQTHLSLRRIHQQVQRQNAQLQQEIAGRKRTEDALRTANATKDTFFSIMAHDLRSPFTALLGYTNLALGSFETLSHEDLKHHITQIKTSTEALYDLLGNLLTWSRVQRGVIDIRPLDVPLHRLIEEVFHVLSSYAEHKQIVLDAHIPEAMIVHADPNMINTVMRNLVSNAIKFTAPGGSIVITAQQRDAMVNISVADTGEGIPADLLPNLFRVDVKTTTPGTAGEKGTGLGLPLCKDLIETNGGTIRVTSTPGRGTTFELTLPSPHNALHDDLPVWHGHHAEKPAEPHHEPHAPVMTGEAFQTALARLPRAWQTELCHAAETLDPMTFERMIERIRQQDERLADALTTIAQGYQYHLIQEAFEDIT